MNKKVALVLASGGSRGMAHIGAIEELIDRGYEITSISGCSIGSLIGGIYASGKLAEAHEWFCKLDRQQILSLTDFSLGFSHVVKGDKVLHAIQEFVPDRNIEDLPIPCAFVATDIINAGEVVFRSGSLFEAIRASISIPMFFRPVKYKNTLLVDGGLVNPFPLNQVARLEDDILIGVNISARDSMDIKLASDKPQREHEEFGIDLPGAPQMLQRFTKLANQWDRVSDKLEQQIEKGVQQIEQQVQRLEQMRLEREEESIPTELNYFSLINRSIDVQIQRNGELMTQFYRPDVLVEMPQNMYTTFDFDKAEEILQSGRERMRLALDEYEAQHNN